jgi:hypothetical protein
VHAATFQFALDSGFAQNMAQWTIPASAVRAGSSPSPSPSASVTPGSPD